MTPVHRPKPTTQRRRLMILLPFLGLPLLLLVACPAGAQATPAVAKRAPVPGHFDDVTSKVHAEFLGQASHTSKKYLMETMGSGVALFDYDNDGLLDIFFVNGAPLADPTPKGSIPQKTDARYWNRLFIRRRMARSKMLRRRPGSRVWATGWGSLSGTMTMMGMKTSS